MICADYIVVGSGLTGATIARMLHDAGREVLVLERRSHVGGNVHDSLHPSGIRVHTYGPHYFRTGSRKIWEFVTRFSRFYEYRARLCSDVDGRLENWPPLKSRVDRLAGKNWHPGFIGKPSNFEEASLAMMPAVIYEKFVKPYTEKQWGVQAQTLMPHLARRFEIRQGHEVHLSRHKYQGLPSEGYHAWMNNMLAGIPVLLNTDYLRLSCDVKCKRSLVFTGSIDELLSYRFGRLKYRGQRRVHYCLPEVKEFQPCAQVNNPDPCRGDHIRTIEWKHLMDSHSIDKIHGTVITTETPYTVTNVDCREYPFPDLLNQNLYRQYARCVASIPKLTVCGRLGEYRYYDMDQAIGRGVSIAKRILSCEAA
jgi:UDP-galactopyranose mutase